MAERTIAEAAAQLGVSTDTVKRRVRSGALHSRRGADGRVVIDLPDAAPGDLHAGAPPLHGDDVVALRERLAATAAERDWLRERVERAEAEREQLRILLGNAQQQLTHALPSAPQPAPQAVEHHDPGDAQPDASRTPWWRRWFAP